MLKSLDEHNRERHEWWIARSQGKREGNGIACPVCGEEMYDINPSMELMSLPPLKEVYCVKCGFRGLRIA